MIKVKHFLRYDRTTRFIVFISILLACLLLFIAIQEFLRPHVLKISFYDVGQGDSIFIETPARFQMLVDGGPGPAVLETLAKDMPFYDRSLNLLISTHPDSDHVSGLIDVLERYSVATIFLTLRIGVTPIYERFLEDAANEGAIIKQGASLPEKVPLMLPGGVSLTILNPNPDELAQSTNDAGIVSLLTYKKFKALLLADVTNTVEEKILPSLEEGITVVKIAHHGSRFSSGQHFLSSIAPQLCVISVGKNHYGHPAPEALASMQQAGCKIWRTDRQGTLTLVSDGESYWRQ